MKKYVNIGNASVIAITFVLFVLALITTGLTKNLLLEAGVFLVSIKIILMNYKTSQSTKEILNELQKIREKLESPRDYEIRQQDQTGKKNE
jgi:hypothetical protein